ncbi:hypothetical protein PIB30_075740 [Stylosanthes scabra]|uniref:Replication factor A C-terminal domain-containing protein n=1 Tax=Stylosanthes scabra TaxID=79078 RepID=A0ABU6UNX5_9FABA|nr:hypothetical protein [Stylosanthes scabra]
MIEQGVCGTQSPAISNEFKVVSLEDDFICLTRRCTIDDLQDNNEEGCFVVFGSVRALVDEGPWWYSACFCGRAIQPQGGAYYCDFCGHYVTNVNPRFRVKICVEDETGHGIFVLFDREISFLIKKSCAEDFAEVQKDANVMCGDFYPTILHGLVRKMVLLKVDTKPVGIDKYFGTFRVRRVCDDPLIIGMFKHPNYDADDELSPKKI